MSPSVPGLDHAVVGRLIHRVVVALIADLEDLAVLRAAARMRSQPATSHAIIFSQSTCLPASRQPTAMSACAHSGGAMITASMSSFWSISCQSA